MEDAENILYTELSGKNMNDDKNDKSDDNEDESEENNYNHNILCKYIYISLIKINKLYIFYLLNSNNKQSKY